MSSSPTIRPVEPHPSARARVLATGLFGLMALLFLVAVIEESAYPQLSWLRAFAEAAMVGALADWYAVTALFRRPMGLPIPHTAIIPANKDGIAARIGSLTQRQLMTPASLAMLIGSWRIPEELTEALLDEKRRRTVVEEGVRLLVRLLDACEDAAMQRVLRELAAKLLRGVSLAPLAGRLLSAFLRSSRRDRLVSDALSALGDAVEANRTHLCGLIAEKLPLARLLSLIKLDDHVANKVLDALLAALSTMKDDPHDAMRVHAIERVERLARWLIEADDASAKEDAFKEKVLAYETLREFFDESWHELKQWILDDVQQQDRSEIRTYLDAALADLGRTLQTDAELQAVLHGGVQGLVENLAARHSDKIGELVAKTIREWSVTHMVDTIEREVGKDLQFIRINGTLVGGLVGLGLHAAARLLLEHAT